MAKLLPILAVFALSVNLFAGLLVGTGAAADLGINPTVGGDDTVAESQDQASSFKSGAPTGSTLFGMYNVVSGVLSTIAMPVTALPAMLSRAGTPRAITDMLQGVLIVVYAMGIASFLRGYSLNN